MPTTIADPANLFGPSQTANAISTNANPVFAAANLVDRTNAAFLFADGSGPQRLAISNFNAVVATTVLRYAELHRPRRPSVTIYYSPVRRCRCRRQATRSWAVPAADDQHRRRLQGESTRRRLARGPSEGDRPSSRSDGDDQLRRTRQPGDSARHAEHPAGFRLNPAGTAYGFSEIQALGYPSPAGRPTRRYSAWGQNVYQKTVASLKKPEEQSCRRRVDQRHASGGDSGYRLCLAGGGDVPHAG